MSPWVPLCDGSFSHYLLSRCRRSALSVHIRGNIHTVPISPFQGPPLQPALDTSRAETMNSRPPVDMWRDQISLPGRYQLIRVPCSRCARAPTQSSRLVLIRALDQTSRHTVLHIFQHSLTREMRRL